MSFSRQDKLNDPIELLGRLCNQDLDSEGHDQLNEALASDLEMQRLYVQYLDLQAALRTQAQSVGDEDFALLEAQAALDTVSAADVPGTDRIVEQSFPAGESRIVPIVGSASALRQLTARPLVWLTAVAVLLIVAVPVWRRANKSAPVDGSRSTATDEGGAAETANLIAAQLRGSVGARWAGDRLELPEGEKFYPGRRLELVEGLAEIYFNSGARVIAQGPTIIDVCDAGLATVSVGRVAVSVPEDAEAFRVETTVASLAGPVAEYGVEVDVDGSLATHVYHGEVSIHLGGSTKNTSTLKLVEDQAAEVNAQSGKAAVIPESTKLRFVRYLPRRESHINLAEVVAGGGGASAYHRGVSLVHGRFVDDYGPPALGDGKYHVTHVVDFVDGVFIPNGRLGPMQVDSIGRTFAGFPVTSGDCWGGAIMARRPRYESSLPLIRLEFFGDNYGYVNWLHVAGNPDELTPQGLGLIGMHSNCGVTFDLHAMRARYPDRQITRFRALVGNLESKAELPEDEHTAEAWVLVDGKLRHHRRSFSRESGPEEIEVALSDRDRFLVLAVTDDGGNTAYDWVAFGDAVIEMNLREGISINRRQKRRDVEVRFALLQ